MISYPVVFKVGSLSIATLGLLTAIGFVLAAYSLYCHAKEENMSEEEIFDKFFGVVFVSFLLGRFFYLGQLYLHEQIDLASSLFLFRNPGFSFWGIVLGVWLGFFVLLQKSKIDYFRLLDLFVFPALVFQFFVSLGSYLEGSYIGFSSQLQLGGHQLKWRHPLALYELMLIVIAYLLLKKLSQEYRTFSWYQGKKGEAKPGFIAFSYLLFWGAAKFGLVFFQPHPLYLKSLKIALALGIVVFSLVAIYLRSGLFANNNLKEKLVFVKRKAKLPKAVFSKKKKRKDRRLGRLRKRNYKSGQDVK